jgi:hypothetical protein
MNQKKIKTIFCIYCLQDSEMYIDKQHFLRGYFLLDLPIHTVGEFPQESLNSRFIELLFKEKIAKKGTLKSIVYLGLLIYHSFKMKIKCG